MSDGTETTNYELFKPDVESVGWGEEVNQNFDTLDSELKKKEAKVNGSKVDSPDFSNDEIVHSVTGSTITSQLSSAIKTDIAKGLIAHGTIALTKEPTGFTSPNGLETIGVSYDQANRRVTLTGVFEGYYKGEKIVELTDGWVSPQHDEDPTTTLFLKYNSNGFEWTTTPWEFSEMQIAYACYRIDGAFCFGQREPHGFMQHQSHKEFHETIGTYRTSGGNLIDFEPQSTTATERRPDIEDTYVSDEDLPSKILALTTKAYTRCYTNGTGKSEFDVDETEIINLTGNIPNYNQVTAGIGSQVAMNSGQTTRYMSVWVIALPTTSDATSQKFRYLFKQGQSASSDIAVERGLNPQDLFLGDLEEISPEFVFTNQIILRYRASPTNNWDIFEVRALTGNRFIQTGSPSGQFLSVVSTGDGLTGNGTPTSPLQPVGAISFIADNGDTEIETGELTFGADAVKSGTIEKAIMRVDTSSTITVDIYVNGTKISDDAPLTITAGTTLTETTFTGWDKTISVGDYITANVTANDNATKLSIQLTTG